MRGWLCGLGVAATVVIAMLMRSGPHGVLGNAFNRNIAAVEPSQPQSLTMPVKASHPKTKEIEHKEVVEIEPMKRGITKSDHTPSKPATSAARQAVVELPDDFPREIVLTPPAPREKANLPNDDAQRQALASIRALFKDEYKAGAANLADKLLWKGKGERDPTVRYVLLRQAIDVAICRLDTKTAFAAVDELAFTHKVDPLEMEAEVIDKSAVFAQLPSQRESIADQAIDVVEMALAADDIVVAKRLCTLALAQAQLSGNKGLIKAVAAKNRVVDLAERFQKEVQDASTTLASVPTDPAANLTLGKYRCFVKGDWDGGLPLLALGNDIELKTLAERDCAGEISASGRVASGDAWWKRSAREEDVAKQQIQGRAVYWYKKPLRGVTELEKNTVEKRIATYESQFSDADHYWRTIGGVKALSADPFPGTSATPKPKAAPKKPAGVR